MRFRNCVIAWKIWNDVALYLRVKAIITKEGKLQKVNMDFFSLTQKAILQVEHN